MFVQHGQGLAGRAALLYALGRISTFPLVQSCLHGALSQPGIHSCLQQYCVLLLSPSSSPSWPLLILPGSCKAQLPHSEAGNRPKQAQGRPVA